MTNLPRPTDGRRRGLLARLIGNGLGHAVCTAVHALTVEAAFDRFVGASVGLTWSTGVAYGAALIASSGGIALLRAFERTTAERLGQDFAFDVRMRLYDRIANLAPRVLQRKTQGGIMLRFVGDLSALQKWATFGLARIVVAATATLGAMVALAVLSTRMALVVGVVMLVGTALTISRGHPLRQASRRARHDRSTLAANVNEKIASMAVVQAFGRVVSERSRIEEEGRRLVESTVSKARVVGQLRGTADATAGVAWAAALLVGSAEIGAGRATPGTVAATMTIVGLMLSPLRDLGRVQEYWHDSRVSLEKIQRFMDLPSLVAEAPNAVDLSPGPGQLSLEDIRLKRALRGVSAAADPGSAVAIVGPNAAGKSTLLAVIARLIDPDSGAVYLDGQDLAMVSIASARHAVGMVSPDQPLLRGTVLDNVMYRMPDASDEEVARVVSLCRLEEFASKLPHGMETKISEGGKGLSSGQRQRIALARALLGSPRLLLLDEVDAHLDAKAAEIVDDVIAQHSGTALIVTHRLERVAAADAVWHLRRGKLVESGPPAEVLQSAGPTAKLFGLETESGAPALPSAESAGR
jgi:ABC-type multidrug transport system fused ATPase/permease subunit